MRIILLTVLLLLSGMASASEDERCPTAPIFKRPFPQAPSRAEIESAEVLLLDHPFIGKVLARESVPEEKLATLAQELKAARLVGLQKVLTRYLIKISLKDGRILKLKATAQEFSLQENDCYYRFKHEHFLEQLAPTIINPPAASQPRASAKPAPNSQAAAPVEIAT